MRLQLIENPEKDPIVIHANRCKKAPNTRVPQREVRNYPLRSRTQPENTESSQICMLSSYKKIPKSKEPEEQKAECSSSLSSVINRFKTKISIKG